MRRVIAIGLLLLASSSHAGIYRWTDSDEKLYFLDQPSEDSIVSAEVSLKMSLINRDSSAEEIEKLQQVFQGETVEEKVFHNQQQVQQTQQNQASERAYPEAKNNLGLLKCRVYFEDADGNEIIVTEEQRANQPAEAIRQQYA
ncbi:MAG: DNA-directed RNA polymerase beta' subunit [Porticoccus sp.]|jgi:DNA-directed RNA polymerase beta' subunit